jgi:hypothetical protein
MLNIEILISPAIDLLKIAGKGNSEYNTPLPAYKGSRLRHKYINLCHCQFHTGILLFCQRRVQLLLRARMSLPNIPLHWIVEYAVSEPTKFTNNFILGLFISFGFNGSASRSNHFTRRSASNPSNCAYCSFEAHFRSFGWFIGMRR